ncbi:hypothetical protein [Dyella sp.]|uniref:hypothetical protein n=1 Tax=Dyella sp. TaxID=1869338 RepID=UPI002FD8D53A
MKSEATAGLHIARRPRLARKISLRRTNVPIKNALRRDRTALRLNAALHADLKKGPR